MSGDVWIDSVRCFDAIASLRTSVPAPTGVRSSTVGDAAADAVLHRLADLAERCPLGVAEATNALADEAMLRAFEVISADTW